LLERKPYKFQSDLNIGVIRLPRISNFTDFDPLEAEASVTVRYISPKQDLGHPDAVIIPGSKTTIADLMVLQNRHGRSDKKLRCRWWNCLGNLRRLPNVGSNDN
jgi:adenosylcobyric acid synthase